MDTTACTRKSDRDRVENLKTRLDLLYPNQYQLQIDDRESQYCVTLVIPFLG